MKYLLLATTALLSFGACAAAADLPSRKAPAQFVESPARVYDWTGVYLGLNAGAALGNNNSSNGYSAFGFSPLNTPAAYYGYSWANNGTAQFIGGGQLGYNYQVGQLVFGGEADLQWLTNGGHGNGSSAAPVLTQPTAYAVVNGRGRDNTDYFGTVRARLGYAMDRTLLYVTGGWAYGDTSNRSATIDYYAPLATPGIPSASYANTSGAGSRSGYALGGGVEYALSNNWTAKAEYLYVDLGGRKYTSYASPALVAAGTGFVTNGRNSDQFSVVRLGVNYKF